MGCNFFITENDIGKSKASICQPKVYYFIYLQLQELNSGVSVIVADKINEELVSKQTVVVFTCGKLSELLKWDEFCHNHKPNPIGFISGQIFGPTGGVFVDFGENFIITDDTGETPIVKVITNIECTKEYYYLNIYSGFISLLSPPDGTAHGIPDDDHSGWVEISGVEGCLAQTPEAKKHGDSINGLWRVHHVYNKLI